MPPGPQIDYYDPPGPPIPDAGARLISAIALLGLMALTLGLLTTEVPEGNADLVNVLVGAWAACGVQAVNYWLGSSVGSKAKDDTIRNVVQRREP